MSQQEKEEIFKSLHLNMLELANDFKKTGKITDFKVIECSENDDEQPKIELS